MKRYSVTDPTGYYVGGGPTMDEDADGEYVKHSDAAPAWTTELPTVEGAYWVRRPGFDLLLVHVLGDHPLTMVASSEMWEGQYLPLNMLPDHWNCEWCGPLYKPEK